MFALFYKIDNMATGLNIIDNRPFLWHGLLPLIVGICFAKAFLKLENNYSIGGMPVISFGLWVTGNLCNYSSNLPFSLGAIFTGAAISGLAQRALYEFKEEGVDFT